VEFTVTTGRDGRVGVFFSDDGRLTDADGQVIFTDRVFADAMDAEFWLLTDQFVQFMGAYMAKKKSESYRRSPTIDLLSFYDVEPARTNGSV
jgi:hypothetical protein